MKPVITWSKDKLFIGSLLLGVLLVVVASCESQPQQQRMMFGSSNVSAESQRARAALQRTPIRHYASVEDYRRDLNLRDRILPRGRHGRVSPARPMRPRYITIHATANPTGGADAHARALYNGRLTARKSSTGNRIGYLIWHFTVEDRVAMQHLPTNEQGEHADFSGPGNLYSIGIEMCEHRGNDLGQTIDRTARLAAWLMMEEGIALGGVVPHYHWPRNGVSKPHKNCPRWLLDNGRPGYTWRLFMERIRAYEQQLRGLTAPVSSANSQRVVRGLGPGRMLR